MSWFYASSIPTLPSFVMAAYVPSSCVVSGATLTGWNDVSGNGHHITSVPTAPTLVNLLDDTWVNFAGSAYITLPNSVSVDARDTAVFVVSQQTGTTGSGRAASLGDGLSVGVGWTGDSMPSGELSRGSNLGGAAANKLWAGFGWQLHGRVNTAAESRFWLDLENSAAAAVASSTLTGGVIGRNPFNSSNYWNALIKAVFVFATAPDASQLAALRAYCQHYFRVGSTVMNTCYAVDGDSITAGGVGGALPWAFFMGGNAAVGHDNIRPKFRNYATGGHTLAQILSGIQNPINWLTDMTAYSTKIHIVMGGVNSLGLATLAEMQSDMTAIVSAVHAAGFLSCVLTVLPATSVTGDLETKRQDFNTWIMAGSSGSDYEVDLRGITELTDPSNTAYFSDGVHPTSTGEKLIGDAVYSTLFP